jgi:myo-inositol-1(or 4)-monophosphatase
VEDKLIMNIDKEFVEILKDLVVTLYNEAKEINNLNVVNKELNDIVTDIDLYMEKGIVKKLQEWFPEYSIYSEEMGECNKKGEYEWFIDPIDGTINFVSGLPLFTTTMALNKNGETIFGFIYDYTRNDLYYAIKGEGAYCNGEKISVSSTENLSDSIISFLLTSHFNDERIAQTLEVEKNLANKVRGLRLIVSASIELAWCATGKIEGCINVKPSIGLGSAAGKLMVTEAGGQVTNIKGNKRRKIDTMLVSNGKIHKELVNALNYSVFFGSITEVVEIIDDKEGESKLYTAGKAFSQAMVASEVGVNVKLLTAVSGSQKKGLNDLYSKCKEKGIDASYIKVDNNIENDIKLVVTKNDGKKVREEDLLKGSSEAVDINLINENIELIKMAKYVVCQTKINPKVVSHLIEVCNENDVSVILILSNHSKISEIDISKNKELLNKCKFIIGNKKELETIFGEKENILEKFENKVILIEEKYVQYYNGQNYVKMYSKGNENLDTIGAVDVLVGRFVRAMSEGLDLLEGLQEGIKYDLIYANEGTIPSTNHAKEVEDMYNIEIEYK